MSTEKRLWKRVRAAWGGHAVRIEASEGGCDPGTPDTNLSIGGRGCWIELKIWPEPLQPTQLPWHIDCLQRGGSAWVLCEMPNGDVWLGSAEEYDGFIRERTKRIGQFLPARSTPKSVSLQAALNMIACVLCR